MSLGDGVIVIGQFVSAGKRGWVSKKTGEKNYTPEVTLMFEGASEPTKVEVSPALVGELAGTRLGARVALRGNVDMFGKLLCTETVQSPAAAAAGASSAARQTA